MEFDERDSAEIRKLILTTLKDIRKNISVDFDIVVEPDSKFGENIVLKMHPESTEIMKVGKNMDEETYQKEGAEIIFHQIYSNGSEVSYTMSHIEGLTKKAKAVLKERVSRGTISKQYIMEKVLAFLQEVVEFER